MFSVLLIEPDKVLAKAYKQQLTLAGFNVAVVHDGHEAVIAIDESMPNAIILEPQLAGHSGIEFLHEFRSYDDWKNIPVIINTSVPEQVFGVDESVWYRLGVIRYFYKPKTTAKQLIGELKSLEQQE